MFDIESFNKINKQMCYNTIIKKGQSSKAVAFCYWWGEMRDTELCMKYDTCKRCPKNKQCEKEYEKHNKWERKNREEKRKIKRGYYVKDL